jgi:fructuronate reductase
MKLRMLNGTHSSMAYLGYLDGYEFVADVIANADYRRFISNELREEIAPTLGMPQAQTDAYAEKLLARYSNTALKHRTYQIAMDGSQKLPQRLLGTIADRLRAGAPIERLSLAVAAWMIYAQGTGLKGEPIVVQDPMAADFAAIDPGRLVEGYLRLDRIFPRELAGSDVFRTGLEQKLALLRQVGPAEAVRRTA